jgi:hypothetical protein
VIAVAGGVKGYLAPAPSPVPPCLAFDSDVAFFFDEVFFLAVLSESGLAVWCAEGLP